MNSVTAAAACSDIDLTASKRQTIESFLAFADGDDMPRWPLELFLEISNVCNLKCAMCSTFSALNPQRYVELKMADRGFIDLKNIQFSLDELLQHALNVHCFGYGEPTVHPGFREFLSFISGYRVMIDFFTNGMHLTPDLCAFLVDTRVERITISFSGLTKEEYENVYLGGRYETVLQGIKWLAAAKERQRSAYPLIEINSLSFEHHVQKLDRFVDFMADHGANVIHLKRLQTQFSIPELKGHEAMLRPWVEGDVLARAGKRAKARGIVLSAAQFQLTEVTSDREWRVGKSHQGLPGNSPSEAIVPISEFKRLSKSAQPIRPPAHGHAEEADTYHEVAAERIPSYLGIKPPSTPGKPFYCMEPFKTLYVRRNGFVKPCCFANDRAPALGTTLQQQGTEIWRGHRYDAVRTGILNQRYPEAACSYCLKHKIGPRGHNADGKIDAYLSWYRQNFGHPLMPSPVPKLKALGDNDHLAQRFMNKHPDLRLETALRAQNPDAQRIRHPRVVHQIAERIGALNRHGQPLDSVIEGYLDGVNNGKVSGWVWSPLFPRRRFDVLLYDFDTEIGCITANRFRTDLHQARKHDGSCAFVFEIPRELYDGGVHGFRARMLGTDFYLRSAPIMVTLSAPPPVSKPRTRKSEAAGPRPGGARRQRPTPPHR